MREDRHEQMLAGLSDVFALAHARAAVWLRGDPEDAVERAFQVCEAYLRLRKAAYDDDGIANLVAPWLRQLEQMPDRGDTFERMVDYALAEERWRIWRWRVSDRLGIREDELDIAQRVAEAGLFDLNALRATYRYEHLYRLCQGWYRRTPPLVPLVTKVRTNVYEPTAAFKALFTDAPARPDPLGDLPPYPGPAMKKAWHRE